MSDADWLTVMFCCNDCHGADTGTVAEIAVDDLIQLEGPTDFDDEDLPATTPFVCWVTPLYSFRVGGETFRGTYRRRHVGNILWDSVRMPRGEFCRLLNYLVGTKEWSCTEAEMSLFKAWRGGEPITVEMLEGAIRT